jgi:hypothetical protein
MSYERQSNNASNAKKRKRGEKEIIQSKKGNRKRAKGTSDTKDTGVVVNVDQLAWKKISLQNDEFDDFEEIEGVDVDYVDKDGSKVIQFKVEILLLKANGVLACK